MSIVLPGIGAAAGSLGGGPLVAFGLDAASNSTGTQGSTTWSHAGNTPSGVIVIIPMKGSGTEYATAVSYGGVALQRLVNSPFGKTTGGRAGAVDIWWKSGGLGSGTKTVSVTMSGSTSFWSGTCYTLNSSTGGIAIHETAQTKSDSIASPAPTINLGSTQCFIAQGFMVNLNNSAWYAPWTGWTGRNEYAPGSGSVGVYDYSTIASGTITYGYNHNAGDGATDSVIFLVAIKEGTAGSTARLLEDGTTRILEDTTTRYLEAA
jgi:hypothetical protein